MREYMSGVLNSISIVPRIVLVCKEDNSGYLYFIDVPFLVDKDHTSVSLSTS